MRRLWIEQASDIAKEYYLSLTFDRGAKKALYMFTTQGGVDIEQVAEESPEALVRLHVDPLEGFHPWQARRLVYGGGVTDPSEQKQIAAIVGKLHEAFVRFDAMLCEINPLIVTPDGEVKALDSKFTVDDNALYRHPDIGEMRDLDAADPLEALAREKHVTYVKLDGEVGVLGNGAGLSMSTVDVVTFAGGRPANFCDLGGGGDAQGVVDALSVITKDPQVKAIFFNIFGGITRCDEVARGILQALERDVARAADRRPARRDERGGGPAHPRRGGAREPPRLADDARGRAARGGAGGVTSDLWSERAQAYVDSDAHREGADLDLLVEWAAGARTALDVATGGGHVARRLREAGIEVVTCDPAPGMRPDVICRAESLPFAGGAFDVVACRTAAHHFADVRPRSRRWRASAATACSSSTRPSWATTRRRRRRCATPRMSATTPRPSGAAFVEGAGLRIDDVRHFEHSFDFAAWLARTGCEGEEAEPAERLLGDRVADGRLTLAKLAILAEGRLMAIFVDAETRLVVQGLTGSEGRFHGLRNRAYGTTLVAGVTPGQGRPGRRGRAGPRHGRGGSARARRQHVDGLRPGAVRRRRRLRGRRRRHRDGDRDHRGRPGPRHAADPLLHPGARRPDARPELPRRALPGQGERRDHPRRDLHARATSASSRARGR